MKKVIFFDNPHSPAVDKSVAGGFGSITKVDGVIGRIYTGIKAKSLSMPALSMVYGVSIFNSLGWDVTIAGNIEDVRTLRKPQIVFVHIGMPTIFKDIEELKKLRELFPKSKLVCFGSFSKERPDLLKSYCDHVIVDGEPEQAFKLLALSDEISGLEIKAGQLSELDTLPIPLWSKFPYKKYKYRPFLPPGPALPLMLTRGCPYNCHYCNYMPQYGSNLRYRSMDNILGEIRTLVNTYKVHNWIFRDLVFTINKTFTRDFCKELRRFNLSGHWSIETRTDLLDFKIMEEMRDAGLKHMNLGIESFNADRLKQIGRKPDKVKHQEEVIKMADSLGIKVSAFYILGIPGEDSTKILKNIDYAKSLNTFAAQFCLLTPYPGTPLFEQLKDSLLTGDWSRFTEYDPVLSLKDISPEELNNLKNLAYRQYYTNPKWVFKHYKRLLSWG